PDAIDGDPRLELGAEFRGVLGKLLRELVPEDRLEAGIILDQLRVQQLAAGKTPLEHDRLEHRTACVHPGAHPRGTGADDDDVVLKGCSHAFKCIEVIPSEARDYRRTCRPPSTMSVSP